MGYSKLDKISQEEFESIIAQANNQQEAMKMFGYTNAGGYTIQVINRKISEYGTDISHWGRSQRSPQKLSSDEIFIADSSASQDVLRRRYLLLPEIPYECSLCKQPPFFNGKELKLRLDHINGNNKDNRKENLRWLCPNCDSQQETCCGKNVEHDK